MKLWWLSFADPDKPSGQQFLGASIVKATSFHEAIRVSHILKINPGGEVKIARIPDDLAENIPESHIERLLNLTECAEVDKYMGGIGKAEKWD